MRMPRPPFARRAEASVDQYQFVACEWLHAAHGVP